MSASNLPEKQKVQVWITSQGPPNAPLVLLLKTKPDRGGFWQPVTGSVDEGESLPHAAEREAVEETGFSFPEGVHSLGFDFKYEAKGSSFHEYVFSGEVSQTSRKQPEPRLDPHEHVESKWVSPDEAFQLIRFESNKQALQMLCQKQGYKLKSTK